MEEQLKKIIKDKLKLVIYEHEHPSSWRDHQFEKGMSQGKNDLAKELLEMLRKNNG